MDKTKTVWIVVGRLSGLFGVRGWLRIFSYTEPRDAIIQYNPLYLQYDSATGWQEISLQQGRVHGRGVIAKFAGIDDRDTAVGYLNKDLAIRREQLPELDADEYYWSDLHGLEVVTVSGVTLGVVDHVFATGANDVVVVEGRRQHLIPFLQGSVIKNVDMDRSVMRVDWDPDF